MIKVLVLVGPTAVGKTSFSIELARRFDGEIISGDSIQVFRGLDIGSGKIREEEKQGIPHYGIDILDPKEKTSVADFQKQARLQIRDIHDRGHLPMIVGGTGLYVKATLYDYEFSPANPQEEQRTRQLEQEDGEVLYARLQAADPQAAALIHPHNKRRTIRALVIHELAERNKSDAESLQQHAPIYDVFILGLTAPREVLVDRIAQRIDGMLEGGLEDEIRGLLEKGVRFEDQSMQGIGYKEWQGYFEGTLTREEVRNQILIHSRQFARRQMTWFSRQTPVRWIDLSHAEEHQQVFLELEHWLKGESQ